MEYLFVDIFILAIILTLDMPEEKGLTQQIQHMLFKTVEIPHYPIREFTQSATNIRLSHRYTGVS